MIKASAYGVPEWSAWVPELTRARDTRNARAARIRRVSVILVVVTLLTAASATAVSLLRDDGPPHPEAWDPEVQELVDFVEAARGADFAEPVYIDFLSDPDFEARVRSDAPARTSAGEPGFARTAEVFTALGLVDGTARAGDVLHARTSDGYYNYDDERIRIRGTELTPATRSTVVRELTHALQDQRFRVADRLATVEGDPAATAALTSLAAADGRRVEASWRLELGKKQRSTLAAADAESAGRLDPLPAALSAQVTAPDLLAAAALDLAVRTGGEKAVDELFGMPPSTEEHQLDPWTLVAERAVLIGTSPPALAPGEKELAHGTFGAVSWLGLLAGRIPPAQALTAADGWGGDAYVTFVRERTRCVRINYRGDSSGDVGEMRRALAVWVAAAPQGSARVRRTHALLTLESCVAGAVSPVTVGPQEAVALAVSRTALSADLISLGWSRTRARCGSDILATTLSSDQLAGKLDERRVRRLTAGCED